MKGKLIVFESLNGGGKEEQLNRLLRYVYKLDRANLAFLTREPNELDENGKKAREMLASDGSPYGNGLAAVGYFAKNRMTHNKIIGPLLEEGVDVFSDRYYYSNLAYQGAQGISLEKIAEANKLALRPDLTFIFNVTPEEAFRRKNKSGDLKGRKFDSNLVFNRKVLDIYLKLEDILPELMGDNSIVVINGMQPIEKVWKEVKTAYNSRFLS